MGKFLCWTILPLLLAAGQCAASDVPTLIAAVADTAECGQELCLRQVPCSDVSGLTSEKARGHGNHSAPAQVTPEKVDSVAVEILTKTSPATATTASSAEEGFSPNLDASTLPPEEVSAGKSLSRRSVGQSEDKCILVFHPDLKTQLKNDTSEVPTQRNTSWQVWLYGFLSVGFISLSGLFGVIFVPLMKKSIFSVVMRYLVGLGIGALSATSIFQLIPECFEIMDRDFLPSSVVIWTTIWVFFVFESICKILLNNREGQHGHSHGRSDSGGERAAARPIYRPKNENADSIEVDCFLPKSFENGKAESSLMESLPVTSNTKLNKDNKMAFHHRSHDYLATTAAPVKRKSGLASISSVAWMIIIGDGIHNFIDGVSIGAGFTKSNLTGISISLAIIFEEFPHELGDFAILISSGMSVKKALAFNFASACTAFLGLVLGIALESFEINSYIFGLAGGLFLYISLSDLIPQLNLMIDAALEDKEMGRKNAFFIMIQQNLGILSGMGLIFIIAKYGDQITIERL